MNRPPALVIEAVEARYFKNDEDETIAKVAFNLIYNVKLDAKLAFGKWDAKIVGQEMIDENTKSIQPGPCFIDVTGFPKPDKGEVLPLVIRVTGEYNDTEIMKLEPRAFEVEGTGNIKLATAESRLATLTEVYGESGLAELGSVISAVEEISVYPSGYFRPTTAGPAKAEKVGQLKFDIDGEGKQIVTLSPIDISKLSAEKLGVLLGAVREESASTAASHQQQTTVVVGDKSADEIPKAE